MAHKKINLLIHCFILLAFSFCASYVIRKLVLTFPMRWDFETYVKAAQRLWNGEDIYIMTKVSEHNKPPFSALLFLPFAFLSRETAAVIIDCINISMAFLLAWQVKAWLQLGERSLPGGCNPVSLLRLGMTTALAIVIHFNSWMSDILIGQIDLILIALALGAFQSQNAWVSAPMLLTAIFLKPTYLLFFPLIFITQKNKARFALSGTCYTVTLALAYGALVGFGRLGHDHVRFLSFLDESAIKNVGGSYSLVGLGFRLFHTGITFIKIMTLTALGLSFLLGIMKRLTAFERFAMMTWVALAFSALTWRTSVVITLPVLIYGAYALLYWTNGRSFIVFAAVLAMAAATNWIFGPKILGDFLFDRMGVADFPLWNVTFGTFATLAVLKPFFKFEVQGPELLLKNTGIVNCKTL